MKKHVGSSLYHLIAAAVVLPLVATAPSAARAGDLTAAEQCDREAGSEFDLERNRAFPAVATEDIRIGVALSACREAYNQNGGARTQFQLARVLNRAGQKLQSAPNSRRSRWEWPCSGNGQLCRSPCRARHGRYVLRRFADGPALRAGDHGRIAVMRAADRSSA